MTQRFLFAFLCLPFLLPATTYYVSNTGNDSNAGTSTSAPWQTIAKVNANTGHLKPGDSLLFERGGMWREYLRMNASGNASSPILIADYGSGQLPAFSGANAVTGWNVVAEPGFNAYSVPLTATPANVFEDGSYLGYNPVANAAALTTGSFYFDAINKLLYVRTAADDSPAQHLVEVSVRSVEIGMYGNYVTYQNLHATMASYADMNMSSNYSFVTITNCLADYSAGRGIYIADGNAIENNITVTNNLVDWNMQDGIKLSVQGTNYLVSGNEVHHNAFSNHGNLYTGGIYISTANGNFPRQTNVTTQNNLVHENGPLAHPADCPTCGNGIWHDTIGVGSVIQNNTSWGNTGAGIDVEFVGLNGGQSIVNNTTYRNGLYGIYLTRRSHGVLISGNTSYQNLHNIEVIGECGNDPVGMVNNVVSNNTTWGGTSNELVATCGAANEGQNGSGNVYDNNNLGSAYPGFIYYATSNFSTYATWLAFASPAASGSY